MRTFYWKCVMFEKKHPIPIPYFSAHCISDHRTSKPNPNPNSNPNPNHNPTLTLTLTLTIALTMTVLTFWPEMRWSEMKRAEKGVTDF